MRSWALISTAMIRPGTIYIIYNIYIYSLMMIDIYAVWYARIVGTCMYAIEYAMYKVGGPNDSQGKC